MFGRPLIVILHLSSLYPPVSVGGAERVAAILAETQADLGHTVHACSLVPDPAPAGTLSGVATRPLAARNPLWIADAPRYPAAIRLANKAATVFNRRVASEFGALCDDIRPDVLHTHSMVELPPAVWDQAARRGIPVVHTLHDYDMLCVRGALFRDGRHCRPRHAACRVLSSPKRALHDRIDAVAAVSGSVLGTHLEHDLFTHLPAERRRVIWNPLRIGEHTERSRRDAGAPLRFGFLGRLVAEKGLGPLLQACRWLPSQGWTLRIAGKGPERARFEDEAAGLPVTFAGHADATQFLAEVDVLISVPLWDEPFGLTTLEAYAAGCRVIGSERGVIGEVVGEVDPGWTVVPGDVAGLASAMNRAISAGTSLPADRRPAASALLARLAPDTVATEYLHLYEVAREAAHRRVALSGPVAARG